MKHAGKALCRSYKTISAYERCDRRCTTDQLRILASLYGVSALTFVREYELWIALSPRTVSRG